MPADTRPIPIKLQVLQALTAHLEAINGDEGNGFDLRGCVFRGRREFGADSPDAYLSILEGPRPDPGIQTGPNMETSSRWWPLLLQGWVKEEDNDHPLDSCYYLLDVVERRLNRIIDEHGITGLPLFPDEYLLGRTSPAVTGNNFLIQAFSFGPGVILPPTEGLSSKAFMYMPVRVGLATIG